MQDSYQDQRTLALASGTIMLLAWGLVLCGQLFVAACMGVVSIFLMVAGSKRD